MQFDELIAEVRGRMGGATREDAVKAIHATLAILAEHMNRGDVEAVAARLPEPFGATMRVNALDMNHDLRSFYARVAAQEHVPLGYAVEHAQAVCRALMLLLDEQARAHLSIHVWPELLRPSVGDRLAPAMRPRWARHLADGRPGSQHPVNAASPPDRAHHDSVVLADNPHGDRKLSSGRPVFRPQHKP